jgi:hypothetical protein
VFAVPAGHRNSGLSNSAGPFPGVVPSGPDYLVRVEAKLSHESAPGWTELVTFHSAGWSHSASRFVHRLQRNGTIHTGRAKGIARSSRCPGTSAWPDSLSRLPFGVRVRRGGRLGACGAGRTMRPSGQFGKLTSSGSRTLLRCEGRWWTAGRFLGDDRSHCSEGGT